MVCVKAEKNIRAKRKGGQMHEFALCLIIEYCPPHCSHWGFIACRDGSYGVGVLYVVS